MNGHPLKQLTALLPLGMSLAALALVLGHAAFFGVTHEADEGAAAHVFQLLLIAQIPLVAIFAIQWLPRRPAQALGVMALQAIACTLAILAVHFLT